MKFEFNMYAVVLDFDAGTATVEDLLEDGQYGDGRTRKLLVNC